MGTCRRLPDGSIPACAGEPRCLRLLSDRPRVYPRVCGGTVSEASATVTARGLSPRVRGNRVRGVAHPGDEGSIPACAGEPGTRTTSRRRPRVYPRVCGGTD